MVDTGAMIHVVRRDIIQGTFQLENQIVALLSGLIKRVPVLGEVALTVRYGNMVVDLPRVKVVEESVCDLILGTEWIKKSNIIIFAVEEQLVSLSTQPYR